MKESAVKNFLMVVLTAVITAAIVMACGTDMPGAQKAQPTQVVVEEAPAQEEVAIQVVASGSYWGLSANKAFKAIEYGCTRAWKAIQMPYGCVVVIDLTRKGYGHNGITGIFGVVIPRENGVTITGGSGVYVAAKAKMYTFVVIDDKEAAVVQQFSTTDPQWDEELLREFFTTQMGGEVSTIWREGVSDID